MAQIGKDDEEKNRQFNPDQNIGNIGLKKH
jgi:hypothetical protein